MSKRTFENVEVRRAVGTALKRARGFSLLTQDEMAAKVPCSRRAISMWENGEAEQPIAALLAYAAATGLTVDRILEKCAPWDLNPEPAGSGARLALRSCDLHLAVAA